MQNNFYDLRTVCLKYFYYFTTKNIDKLAEMFDDNIELRDWDNSAKGKADVVAIYQNIFDSVDTISVTPYAVYRDNNVTVSELCIRINGKEDILVTDVITFDEDKIVSVRAYKG